MTKNLTCLPGNNLMLPMYALYPVVVITGFIQILIPSTIHTIMTSYDLEPGLAGTMPFIYFSGILISAIAVTHILKIFTVKKLMLLSAAIVSTSLLLCFIVTSYTSLLILYLFIGFGNGLMIILPGIYSTHHYGSKNARIQSATFGYLAIGFIIGPLFPGLIENLGLSWKWCFIIPGFLLFPASVPIILTKYADITNTEKLTLKVLREVIKIDKRFFIGIVVAVTIAAGSATGFLTWLITFLDSKSSTHTGTAHLVLSLMGAGSVIGRLIWAKFTPKRKVYYTLLLIISTVSIVIFIAPIPKSVVINIALFFIATLFLSGINPLFLSAAGIYPKSHASGFYTILFIFMSIGGILIPFFIGQIFQYIGAAFGMSSISFLFIIVLVALLYVRKEIPLSEHINPHILP